MRTGLVKMFNHQNGFGFITPAGGGDDVFVHRSAMVGTAQSTVLKRGDRVEFDVGTGPKGPQAVNGACSSEQLRPGVTVRVTCRL